MKTQLRDLRESNEFLNLLLDNMDQAVLIVDEEFKIFQVNDYFFELFDRAAESVVNNRFGGVSGCIHSVLENKPCGEAQACRECVLRKSVIQTLVERVPADRVRLNRKFYIDNRPVEKYMQFSTRFITYEGRKMTLVLIYDVTETELQKMELQRKQAQIELDLAAAAEIQKSLLPEAVPLAERIKMAWKFEPSGKIGGDIFNIHYYGKDQIGLYMLDVCGHGVSAALIAVAVSQFLASRKTVAEGTSVEQIPQAVLNSLNRSFPFERFDSFFTIIHMTIDTASGILTYSCAGHPPPVVVRKANRLEILDNKGPVIGADENVVYGQDQKQLVPGDKIVLYTDGILELCDKNGEFFGKNRFYAVLEKNAGRTPEELVETLYLSAKTHCGESEIDDDISILVVEYTG